MVDHRCAICSIVLSSDLEQFVFDRTAIGLLKPTRAARILLIEENNLTCLK
jgi:hypothetical protein